jgi:transcriptional regulator with XRE-family HTH domain
MPKKKAQDRLGLVTMRTKKENRSLVEEVLQPFFSPAQIECFLKGSWQRVKKWTQDDICQALTIRLISRRAYKYLRTNRILPLPGISTLEKYFRDFTIEEGYLESVAKLLRTKLTTMEDWEKVCVISFDGIHLTSDVSYDQRHDQIVGQHWTHSRP